MYRLRVRGGGGGFPARCRSAAVLLLWPALIAACGINRNGEEAVVPQRSIEDVLAEHTVLLMRIDGVEGVGQALCDDVPCIRVYLRTAAVAARVPKQIEGYTVSTVVTGMIQPRDTL
jgi:hypothetical protein